MTPLERLTELVRGECPGWTDEEIAKAIDYPDWDSAEIMFDWRSYVLPAFKAEWSNLSREVRLAILAHSEHKAQGEHWD